MLIYVGPDQIIPLSGVIGTVAGLAMIFWGRVVLVFRRLTGQAVEKPESHPDSAE